LAARRKIECRISNQPLSKNILLSIFFKQRENANKYRKEKIFFSKMAFLTENLLLLAFKIEW